MRSHDAPPLRTAIPVFSPLRESLCHRCAVYSRQFLLVNLRLNIDRKLVFSYNCDNNSFVQFIESGGGTGPKKPGNLHVDM